ncbi:hypothetical protein AB0C13_39075, partial [Streptomyces sp. NPDC049099]|uniref:hypothetical protein n=1 Tax=Streptomyces sp. NPDC049099 TaxID=3155768 RepID=UPI00341FCFA0
AAAGLIRHWGPAFGSDPARVPGHHRSHVLEGLLSLVCSLLKAGKAALVWCAGHGNPLKVDL